MRVQGRGALLTLFRADIQKVFLRAQSLKLSWPVMGWLQGVGGRDLGVAGEGWLLQETVEFSGAGPRGGSQRHRLRLRPKCCVG